MSRVVAQLKLLSGSPHPVLVLGERGTGKTLIAELLHGNGPRSSGPLVPVNCATITPQLAESAFFGHEKGAFTGAERQQHGMFERANSGTLFLDEIADLPLEIQGHLLRVVERGRVLRIGARNEITVDVRLVCATNRDLNSQAESGRFRPDLLDRLGILRVVVPPLRERREDIPDIAKAVYREEIRAYESDESRSYPDSLPDDVIARLMEDDWEGNVRQLSTTIVHLVTFNVDGRFDADAVEFAMEQTRSARATTVQTSELPALPHGTSLSAHLEELKARYVEQAIAMAGGDVAKAARLLGMTRQALHQWLTRRRSSC